MPASASPSSSRSLSPTTKPPDDPSTVTPRRSVTFSQPPSPQMSSKRQRSRDGADEAESSSEPDERTAMVGSERGGKRDYSGQGQGGVGIGQSLDGADEQEGMDPGVRRRRSSLGQRGGSGPTTSSTSPRSSNRANENEEGRGKEDTGSWWSRLAEKYGAVELENKGSVARDHLALERTFLAWLRTSLSFASIGIAVTQLFRLNTTISTSPSDPSNPSIFSGSPQAHLRHVGKPLGATFIGVSIVVLFIGFHRYFESQHYIIRGRFPASRGSVTLVAAVTAMLIVASLVVVLAIAPRAFERR